MIEIISHKETDRLLAKLDHIRSRNVAVDDELMRQVAEIVQDVRLRGDAALIEYSERFDGCKLEPSEIRVTEDALRSSASRIDAELGEALRVAISRVRVFHEREVRNSWHMQTIDGTRLGQRVTAIERAGLYVPGGTASYPSSIVMNVVPAQVAGVSSLAVATPPKNIEESPAVAAALLELGVTEVFAIGGAQAIAALAFGTETVGRVDKITGPGNRYVAAAKKLVFGVVGIDSIAGPTEVVIIADGTARASYIASDLLAQAEHGEDASAVLITSSQDLAVAVSAELKNQARNLPRIQVIEKSLADYGAIIIVDDLGEACSLVNDLAPEHLQIICDDEEQLAERILHAGAIFFGEQTPVAAGDYLAGPNHVLPTGGTARFSSALSVSDFLKTTSVIKFSSREMRHTAPFIAALARAEGLDAHALSALRRLEK